MRVTRILSAPLRVLGRVLTGLLKRIAPAVGLYNFAEPKQLDALRPLGIAAAARNEEH